MKIKKFKLKKKTMMQSFMQQSSKGASFAERSQISEPESQQNFKLLIENDSQNELPMNSVQLPSAALVPEIDPWEGKRHSISVEATHIKQMDEKLAQD